MPLYHQIVTTSARAAPATLATLFRRCAKQITAQGGLVRSCENYGLKKLPHRFRSRHASAGEAGRYHYVGRHVALYFDCAPTVLPVVENTLRMHTDVLRFTTMRKDAKMDQVNSLKKSNPWRDLDDVPDAR